MEVNCTHRHYIELELKRAWPTSIFFPSTKRWVHCLQKQYILSFLWKLCQSRSIDCTALHYSDHSFVSAWNALCSVLTFHEILSLLCPNASINFRKHFLNPFMLQYCTFIFKLFNWIWLAISTKKQESHSFSFWETRNMKPECIQSHEHHMHYLFSP